MSSDFSPSHSHIDDWFTTLNLDLLCVQERIETILERLAKEREQKYAELRQLLAADENNGEMPPGVMIAALLASLRRAYNADQLLKARLQLAEMQETVEKLDDLPYLWNR